MKEKLTAFLNWFFKTAILALAASIGCRIVLYFAMGKNGSMFLPNINFSGSLMAWSKSGDIIFLNIYIFFVLILIICSLVCMLTKTSIWTVNMLATLAVFLVLSGLIIFSDLKTGHAAGFIKKSGMLIYIITVPWLTLLGWAVFAAVPAWLLGKSEDDKKLIFSGKSGE